MLFPCFLIERTSHETHCVFCGATCGLVSVTMYCINRRSPSSVCVCVRACVRVYVLALARCDNYLFGYLSYTLLN